MIVQHRHGRLRLLRDVQEAKGAEGEAIDHRVEIDLADALRTTDEEDVGAQKLTRRGTFDMALLEARVQILDEGGLFRRDLDGLAGIGLFQGQPPVIA